MGVVWFISTHINVFRAIKNLLGRVGPYYALPVWYLVGPEGADTCWK